MQGEITAVVTVRYKGGINLGYADIRGPGSERAVVC